MMKERFKTKDITYMAIFIAIISICSWISIPMVIPFTLQTFAIFITVGILGTIKSFVAIFIYILIGALGVPVFANFNSGVSAIVGPTGGYLVGFLIIALVLGKLLELLPKKNIYQIISMVVGLILCYAFGTLWFVYAYTDSAASMGIVKALSLCAVPFIIPDLIKIAIGNIIINRVKKFIN